jgi:hypothetical protein
VCVCVCVCVCMCVCVCEIEKDRERERETQSPLHLKCFNKDKIFLTQFFVRIIAHNRALIKISSYRNIVLNLVYSLNLALKSMILNF